MVADGFEGHVEEFELALGYVTGVRGFLQDSLGRLTGVTYPEIFYPGKNTAECHLCGTKRLGDCSCGYYAYFQNERYGSPETTFYGGEIGAIIRGYGRVVVGPKGFRAEKADLVAFFPIETAQDTWRPPKGITKHSPFRNLYPSVSWYKRWTDTFFLFTSIVLGIAGIMTLTIATATLLFTGPLSAFLVVGSSSAVLIPWLSGWVRRAARADLIYDWMNTAPTVSGRPLRDLYRLCNEGSDPRVSRKASDHKFEKLKKLYTGVPVYKSLREALEVHPLTPPEEHQRPEEQPDTDAGRKLSSGGRVGPGTARALYNATDRLYVDMVRQLTGVRVSPAQARSYLRARGLL